MLILHKGRIKGIMMLGQIEALIITNMLNLRFR